MIQLLMVTTDRDRFSELAAGIESPGMAVNWTASGRQALETIGKTLVDLVVADEDLGDMQGLAFVDRLVAANPMINCALVSSLSKADYHEASEGLGILMQLPPDPTSADGERLMAHLNLILGLSSETPQ